MRLWPKIHDVYVAKVVLGMVLMAWAVLLGLDAVIGGLFTELADIGKGRYGFVDALLHVAYTLPRRAYTLFPTAAVIGALMALGQLAASSELTALRAAGLSRKRLAASVMVGVVALTALMIVNIETIGAYGDRKADATKAAARSNEAVLARYSGLWAREGNTFLNAQDGQERVQGDERWLELRGVRLFEFDDGGQLKSIARVGSAEHRRGEWRLRNVHRTLFDARSVRQATTAEERWDSKLDAKILTANITSPRYLTLHELKGSIDYRQRNGLEASEFEEHYWGRWFYPLNVLALCLAAIPFAFGTLRSGGLGKRMFIGIVFALGFWLLQTQFVKLASVYKFDMRIGYVLPPIIMLMVSWWLFRRRSG